MRKSDNRKQRWQSSCIASGMILIGFAVMLIMAGGKGGLALGVGVIFLAMLDFRDAKRGWKMSDKRPPWADKHDAIDAKYKKKYKF